MAYEISVSLIDPFDRTLFDTRPGVIADARREDSLQMRLLSVGECRLVIGEIDRLQLAFDDVVCKRRSGHHSGLAVNWVERVALSLAVEAGFLDYLIALGVPACVNGLSRFVARDFVGRERRRIGGDGVEPFVHRVERERAQVYAAGLTSLARRPAPDQLIVLTPVGAFEARANRQVAVAVVDVANGVGVRARVKDRDVGHSADAPTYQT